jgi:drug/metabolite transporter (DMT)-like permease
LGWILFGEAPIDDLFPGALLIIGSGLIIIWREQRSKV